MRIIAGKWRGKKLLTPKDERIPPTADRAREAVMSIITSKYGGMSGKRVIDIFSGTGAFGLEALSRGAREATFVDIDLGLTKKNVALCEADAVQYRAGDARRLKAADGVYEIVFMDAPYEQGLSEPTLQRLETMGYIGKATLVIVETARAEDLAVTAGLQVVEERIYGAAKFWFLQPTEDEI